MTSRSTFAWGLVPLVALVLAAAPSHSAEGYGAGESENQNVFIKMCDASPDGKVSRADVMKAVGKMFDKHDTRKEGKLDKRQVELFLKDLTRQTGA